MSKQASILPSNRPEPSPREKTINQYMLENPRGNKCSRCGVGVPSARGAACLCWCCTHLLAQLRATGYWKRKEPKQACPDCGGERPKGTQRCAGCAKKRRREKQRDLMRKKRVVLLAK